MRVHKRGYMFCYQTSMLDDFGSYWLSSVCVLIEARGILGGVACWKPCGMSFAGHQGKKGILRSAHFPVTVLYMASCEW